MMNTPKLTLLSAAVWMLGWSSVQAMTLAEAYSLALAQDAKLASAQSRLQADSELVPQAQSQLLPQVSVGVSNKSESYVLPSQKGSFDEQTSNQNVQVSQPLYARKAWYGVEQASLKVDFAQLRLAGTRAELGIRLSDAFLTFLLAQEHLSLSQQLVTTTERRLAQAQAALKVGYASKVDVLSLSAELDDARAQVITDQQRLLFARQKLKGLIGREVPQQLAWPKIDVAQLQKRLVQGKDWLAEARHVNSDVKLAQIGAEVAQKEVEIRRSEHYPVVNVGAYYSDAQGSTYFAQKNENKAIYIEMKLPLYQGGYATSRVREGEALLRSAEQEVRYAQSEAEKLVQEQLSTLEATQQKLEALAHSIRSGETYLASVEEGYRLGLRDIAEVSRAKEKLFLNQRDQISESLTWVSASLRLKALVGQLNEAEFNELSRLLW